MARRVVNRDKLAEAQAAADAAARGFPSEVAARQWVYDQLGLSEDR